MLPDNPCTGRWVYLPGTPKPEAELWAIIIRAFAGRFEELQEEEEGGATPKEAA